MSNTSPERSVTERQPISQTHHATTPAAHFPELSLRITPLQDPVMDQLGFDARSDYVERYWLSILGPSAVLFLRRIAAAFDEQPEGFDLDLVAWAQELGLGSKGGKHSPMWRTLDRLCRFGLATRNGPNLSMHRHIPPLTRRQIERLPAHLQLEHQAA